MLVMIILFQLCRHLVRLVYLAVIQDQLVADQCRMVFPWAVDALELEVTELIMCLTERVQDLVIRLATVDMVVCLEAVVFQEVEMAGGQRLVTTSTTLTP